jgi:hypothetical protein
MGFDYAGKIRGLLANADSLEAAGNDEAAASFRTKAEEWMRRYKIAEEDALAEDPTAAEPTVLRIDINLPHTDISHRFISIVDTLARHTEVRYDVAVMSRGYGAYRVTVVGYEGDLRYFEFLWTSAYLMFTTKIDPHWSADLPEADNIFALRQAGYKRAEIADKAWGAGAGTVAANRSKVQAIYRRVAAARGVDPSASGLGFNAKDYRQAYVNGFLMRLESRLMAARDAVNAKNGVMVLAGRAERVAEAFYTLFPRQRPSTAVATPYVAPNADCERCKRAKSGYCTDHRWLKPRTWSAADERRWQNQHHGASAQAGRASGEGAADGVMLRGTASPQAQRVEATNQALEG